MRPVTASVAPQQHAGVILVRARHERASAHPMVHRQRLPEMLRRLVESALEAREDAERPADGVERKFGLSDGVLRAVWHQERVEGTSALDVFEARAGLGEQADAGEPLLIDVPVREVVAHELVEYGCGRFWTLCSGVHLGENGAVHERRGKLVRVVPDLALEAVQAALLAVQYE